MTRRAFTATAILVAACSTPGAAPLPTAAASGSSTLGGPSPRAGGSSAGPTSHPALADGGGGPVTGATSAPEATDAGTATPEPSFAEIAAVLHADKAHPEAHAAAACPASLAADARVRCAFDDRFKADRAAAALANELWDKWRIVAGVEVAHTMDGGYRGMIHLVPALPVLADRKHIEWIVEAMRDFERFFAEVDARAVPGHAGPARYRFRPITLRFTRSTGGKRTPSAYAHEWTVAWNLEGSLHTSADAVRETLFHEMFHLNDRVHGAPWWSTSALSRDFDAIVRRCGTALACLAPYTPNDTIVRGGTYYSFQPGNGVVEYAAELALRYYREQRAVLFGLPKRGKAFKCGPPENARSWERMRDEFFSGIDVVPPCP